MATPTPEQMADPEFQRRLSEGMRNFDATLIIRDIKMISSQFASVTEIGNHPDCPFMVVRDRG